MTKLDKLIELNNLEKQNRKNRLEDKLKQQEYYGEKEELFDPLTKTSGRTLSQFGVILPKKINLFCSQFVNDICLLREAAYYVWRNC